LVDWKHKRTLAFLLYSLLNLKTSVT